MLNENEKLYRIWIFEHEIHDSFLHTHHEILAHFISAREQCVLPLLKFHRYQIVNSVINQHNGLSIDTYLSSYKPGRT